MIDQLQVMQALRPSADYCIDGEITESRISTCIRYVVSVDDQCRAVFGDSGDAVTWEQFDAKRNELQTEYDSTEYKRLREPEYPKIGDQLDALLKHLNYRRTQGDQLVQELDDIIGDWLNVKSKYPKD